MHIELNRTQLDTNHTRTKPKQNSYCSYSWLSLFVYSVKSLHWPRSSLPSLGYTFQFYSRVR